MLNYFASLCLILFFTTQSCGQNQKQVYTGSYYVNKEVLDSIDGKITTTDGIPKGSIELIFYINDKLVSDTAPYFVLENSPMNKIFGSSIKNELNTWTTLDGDTANISCFYGMQNGFGFELALFKDTCIIRLNARSATPIYKLCKNDKWSSEVTVPWKFYKLTLANKPKFRKNDVIQGVISLVSDEYYILYDNNENKISVQLKVYFKTVPMQASKRDYDNYKVKPT